MLRQNRIQLTFRTETIGEWTDFADQDVQAGISQSDGNTFAPFSSKGLSRDFQYHTPSVLFNEEALPNIAQCEVLKAAWVQI